MRGAGDEAPERGTLDRVGAMSDEKPPLHVLEREGAVMDIEGAGAWPEYAGGASPPDVGLMGASGNSRDFGSPLSERIRMNVGAVSLARRSLYRASASSSWSSLAATPAVDLFLRFLDSTYSEIAT